MLAWKALGHTMIPLKFEEEDATDINNVEVELTTADDAWYTLSGVRLEGKPAQKGVYIHQGKKVYVK